jgi:hypothetical protein
MNQASLMVADRLVLYSPQIGTFGSVSPPHLLPESFQSREEPEMMPVLKNLIWKMRICQDTRGQELMEYALITGFLACSCAAALPDIGASVLVVFSKVLSVLSPLVDTSSSSSSAN